MKYITVILTSLILISSCAIKKNPKADLKLKHTSISGTNGMSVVYYIPKKQYYTIIGGNTEYPLEAFDKKGKSLGYKETGFDARSLWFNPKEYQLEGNTYNNEGIYALIFAPNAVLPKNQIKTLDNSNQPNEQASAAFDFDENSIIYYENGEVYAYSRENGMFLYKKKLLGIPCDLYDLNKTTIIYTGIKKNEYGLLNYLAKEVYLFDKTNSTLTTTVKLPNDAITSENFRFSFTNNRIWLYDVDLRSWTSYKIK